MNVKGTILNPASKPSFDNSRFTLQSQGSTQMSHIALGATSPQSHASAVKPANKSNLVGLAQSNAYNVARMQQIQSNSSKQSYFVSSSNPAGMHLSYGGNSSSKASLDPTSQSGNMAHGNSSQMSGISMSGLSEHIQRQSSKSSFKDQDSKHVNSNYNSAFPTYQVIASPTHENLFNMGPPQAARHKAAKGPVLASSMQVKASLIQTQKLNRNDKHLREVQALAKQYKQNTQTTKTIFQGFNNGFQHSQVTDDSNKTPSKSDLNETDEQIGQKGKVQSVQKRLKEINVIDKKKNLNTNLSQRCVIASALPISVGNVSHALGTPVLKNEPNPRLQHKMDGILKSKSPEPSLNINNLQTIQQQRQQTGNAHATGYASQPQTNVQKTPAEPIPLSTRDRSKNESIVCPIYPSKDFRLVNPTNSNLKESEKHHSQNESKRPANFVSGKDRPLRSTIQGSQQVPRPKMSDSDNGSLQKYEGLYHLIPKAFSPEPAHNDRISFLPLGDQYSSTKKNGVEVRVSSTVSREPTLEDVYMTQRAQQAILAGKKKKHKKAADQAAYQYEQIQLARKIAEQQYFEGTDQIDIKRALKKSDSKTSQKNLEVQTYLKMLSMSQIEKFSPSVNFSLKLTDSNSAYLTKVKSKSQSGVQPKNSSSSGKKKRDNSQSMSATSSNQDRLSRLRKKSLGPENSNSQSEIGGQKFQKLRKSVLSSSTPNTLQEPSAKAIPSSKVKINAKFNKIQEKERSVGEKNRVQIVQKSQSKKNIFNKKALPQQATTVERVMPQSQSLSPASKTPVIQRAGSRVNINSHVVQFEDMPIGVEGETKLSKQGRAEAEFVLKEHLFQQQVSPISQYYNQLSVVQPVSPTEQTKNYSNSQLFQISQLRHSHQNSKQSVTKDLENSNFSGPAIDGSKLEQPRFNKKRASTVSSKDEQVFDRSKDEGKPIVFECDPAKNFRSTSPHSRETDMQVLTDMKRDKIGTNKILEESKEKQRVFQLKRTSLSPPSNLFFSMQKGEQMTPNEMQKILIRMIPNSSPKVSPDPKVQTQHIQLSQIKQVLGGSSSTASVLKNKHTDSIQRLSNRISPQQTSQKQYLAEMAINQKVLRLSRPTSNDIIKTFKLAKQKFLSPEIKPRDVISPDIVALHGRKASSSPHLSNASQSQSGTNKGRTLKNSGLTTTKTKTNSQLSKLTGQSFGMNHLSSSNGSARALFAKAQAEVVLNRVGQQPKKNKESMVKTKKKVPTAVATVSITKTGSQQSQAELSSVKQSHQLFKKSTLQKSSVIAQQAQKSKHLRDSQELVMLDKHRLQEGKSDIINPMEIDEIPQIEVVDVSTHHRRKKETRKVEEEKKVYDVDKNKTVKKQMMIGDQFYSENQKWKPMVLNPLVNDVVLSPLTKSKDLAGSVLTQPDISKESDKEQQVFNRDLQKLMKMIRLHFAQFNQPPPTTSEFYRIGRVLGKGAFGKVNFAMHKLSEQLVAIKSMSKETLQSEEDLRRRTKLEMGILQQSNHPNVVRLFDTFETEKHICFVMELCSGGDLFSYIKKRRRLKEDVARFFFRQIVEGLAYIHNVKLVVHRDIKLENILLDATGQVKICDFGVSRQLKSEKQVMHEQCGTPAYIAPEILRDQGYSGFKLDMWSAGVCLYAMLIGSVPFKAATMAALQELILKGTYDLKFQTSANSNKLNNPQAAANILSDDVKDLIAKLLNTDPNKRLSAVEALEHPWLKHAPTEFDVFTDKEKTLIQKEYMRLNLKKQATVKDSMAGRSSRHASFSMIQETEQALFTEHNLETKNAEDEEPQMANNEEKSYILAPFNSIKSMFIEQPNQPAKAPETYKWPEEVTRMIVGRKVIKFAKKCREKNRIYEQNNNADLDNGVYNECVNEQEKEEGVLAKKEQDSDEERKQEKKDSDSEVEDLLKSSSSEDSLQMSFKATELSSDDEKADKQIRQTYQEWVNKKDNKQLFNLMDENDEKLEYDKKTPPCVPGVNPGSKRNSIGTSAVAQSVLAYQEKEFCIDQAVVNQIDQMNVIPKAFLLADLAYGSEKIKLRQGDGVEAHPIKKMRKMNYVTATYYLLVKRKELLQLQAKQRSQ